MSKEKQSTMIEKLEPLDGAGHAPATAPPVKTSPHVFIAIRGLNYGDPEVRVEPGGEVYNLPESVVAQFLKDGNIMPEKKSQTGDLQEAD